MIVISHPTGNQNSRNAAEAFYKDSRLAQLYTCLAWKNDSKFNKHLPSFIRQALKRREFNKIPDKLISTHSTLEIARQISIKLGLKYLTRHEIGAFSIDTIYKNLDNYVSKQLSKCKNVKQYYAYEDGALNSFKAAKEINIECIYELPIGYWKMAIRILGEEAQLKPEWANTILSIKESSQKLERKDQELALADKIIVASKFTAETLNLFENFKQPVYTIPYGCPTPIMEPNLRRNKKLKVLFVGGLSQRKGLSYLLDAAAILKDKIELTIIGCRIANCKPLDNALNNYRYIESLPHHKILIEMEQHDALVFPSLFEGFGLVILEAMSRGIPVITTPNTAGPDIIIDGHDGYVIPIRSHEAIAEKLETLANNPDLLDQLKIAALKKASNFSWENYQYQLLQTIR